MRIVMVGSFGLWGKGTMGARALPMARALDRRGHHISIVIPPWDTPTDSGIVQTLDGVRVANIALPPRLPMLWHAIVTVRLLLRTLGERGDVVHIFKPKSYAGLVGTALWCLRALRLVRARLVVDADDWEGTGGWNEKEDFPRVVKWWVACQERWGLRHGDSVTVASRALETLAWSVGAAPHRVHYVPNGGAFPNNRPSAESAPEGREAVILLYTRFFEFRLERVVEVLRRVREAIPGARLLVVGRGLRGEEEEMRRLLAEAGLADGATFAGWVPAQQLPNYFARACVALYPMDDTLLNRAKCPMKLVDLMVAGVPIVAEKVGQVVEYIEDSVSGLLVETGNPAAFAAAVVDLLADPERRRRIGEAARQRVVDNFSWHRLVDEVERAYGLHAAAGSGGAPLMKRATGVSASALVWGWAPALLWMAIIFWVSSQTSLLHWSSQGGLIADPDSLPEFLVKKAAHMAEYAVLGLLLLRALRFSGAPRGRTLVPLLLALALAIGYAASDELHQSFVPGRVARLTDIVFDSVGAALALLLLRWRSREEYLPE